MRRAATICRNINSSNVIGIFLNEGDILNCENVPLLEDRLRTPFSFIA